MKLELEVEAIQVHHIINGTNDKIAIITTNDGTISQVVVGGSTYTTMETMIGQISGAKVWRALDNGLMPTNYTIVFNANGGSGSMTSQNMVYGKTDSLSANSFFAPSSGYAFGGWNTESDKSGTAYTDAGTVSNLTKVDGGIVNLYAVWMAPLSTCYNFSSGTFGITDSGTKPTGALVIPSRIYDVSGTLYDATGTNLGEEVTSIGNFGFYYCSGLTSVTIPGSVTSIGNYAFYGCSNLTTVNYKGSEQKWNAITIGSNNDSLQDTNKLVYNYGS